MYNVLRRGLLSRRSIASHCRVFTVAFSSIVCCFVKIYQIHDFQKKALRNMFPSEKDEIICHLTTVLKEKLLCLHRVSLGY
jgi:hypothetical protein